MRIALVTPYFYPHIGGVESHVYYLARELIELGHEVGVFTSRFEIDLVSRETMDGFLLVRVKPFAIPMTAPIVPGYGEELSRFKPDIVHAHSPSPICSYFAMRWCRKNEVPFVLTHHCDLELSSLLGKMFIAVYRRTLEKRTLDVAARIITTTKTYAQTSRSVWRYACDIIPNAIAIDRFRPDLDGTDIRKRHHLTDEKVVMYVGRVTPHKGLRFLVDSAQHLPSNVRILIVGGGDFREKLERRAEKLGVSEQVIFAGRVSNRDLPYYYAASDLFVLPSISRLEAFGIVALEAMASGVPVLVSDIPGVREVIDPGVNGMLCEPFNDEALARSVMGYLDDPDLYERMKEGGFTHVRTKYSWKTIVKQLEDLFMDVLGMVDEDAPTEEEFREGSKPEDGGQKKLKGLENRSDDHGAGATPDGNGTTVDAPDTEEDQD